MLKRVILTAASVIALTAAANAADMYVPGAATGGYKDAPVATWTGFYVGVNGGYAWSDTSNQLAYSPDLFGGLAPEGGFGGGQIGYNVQRDRIVFGIEADIQGGSISASGTDVLGVDYKSELDYFGTVRGRLGYAFDRALVYATGGLAYGEVKNGAGTTTTTPFTIDKTAVGYVLGGGVEYKIGGAWSVKGEYQYINLGKNDPTFLGIGFSNFPGATVNEDAYHTVRVGLNYHIAPSYEPLK